MNKDCLMKIKTVVHADTYRELETALATGDADVWNKAVAEASGELSNIKRQKIIDSQVISEALTFIQQRADDAVANVDRAKFKTEAKFKKAQKRAYAKETSKALNDLISGSGSRQRAAIVSLDKEIEGIRGPMMAKLTQVLHDTRPALLGLRRIGDGEYMQTLVRAIFGSDVKGMTKELTAISKAWKDTTDELMARFNRAGGAITEMEGYALSTSHDVSKISQVSQEEWIADAKKLFNIRRPPLREGVWDEDAVLEGIYKTLSEDDITPFDMAKIGVHESVKLGNAHQKWRYLQPKNGDAWLEYATKYGRHSRPIDAMVEYIDTMSTNIALMEKLGSNPVDTFGSIVKHAQETTGDRFVGVWAKASLDQIVATNPALDVPGAKAFIALRHYQTATKLGTAPVTAMTDVAYSAVESVYLGMNPLKTFMRHLKLLNPWNEADRILAGQMGLTMDYALSKAAALNRFSDNVGYGLFHTLADVSTRASGLNLWTHAAKTAFGLEALATLGRMATSARGLSKGMKKMFQRYGISEAEWDVLKTTVNKQGYIDVTKLGPEYDRLRSRTIGMIKAETAFAVPEPDAKARALVQGLSSRNTFINEVVKTGTQFKSFGVSVLLSHMGRMLNDTTPVMSRVIYGSSLLAATGAMGVAVIQSKEFFRGRTFRELDLKLAGEGILQGGTLGVLGDLVFTDPEVFGGLPLYTLGPTMGDVVKIHEYFYKVKDEQEAHDFASAWYNEMVPGAIKGANRAAGFATKLWYTRLMWERAVMNRVNEMTDPDFYKKQNRTRKWLQKERGQQLRETWVD